MTAPAPKASILICTRNRAQSLSNTLSAVAKETRDTASSIEVIVVDNGSTDNTADAVAQHRPFFSRLRYVSESKPGKCRAYAAGLSLVCANYVVCIDDDVLPQRDWLNQLLLPLERGEADAVAGTITIPESLEVQLNQPLLRPFRAWFAATDVYDAEGCTQLIGANMAICRHVFDQLTGFDVALGPGALGFGEETLFGLRMLDAGFRIGRARDAVVEHHFDSTRLTKRGILGIAEGMARSEAYIAYHWRHNVDGPWPKPALRNHFVWAVRTLLRFPSASQALARWEIDQKMWTCYWDQIRQESSRPPRYAVRSTQR